MGPLFSTVFSPSANIHFVLWNCFFVVYIPLHSPFFFSTCQSKKLVYCYFEKITNMLLVCLLEKTLSVHFCLCFFYKEEIGTISHTFLTFSTDSFVSGLTSDFRE